MAPQTALLMAWLEGEGERQSRPTTLPPQVGDPAVRGRVHVGVCVLGTILTAGLFICWLDRARRLAVQVGSGPAGVADRTFVVGKPVTLKDCRVERIVHDVEAGGGSLRPQALILSYRDLSLFCEFGEEDAIGKVHVGDILSIWSATGPSEAASVPMVLLRDCQLIEGVNEERRDPEPSAAPDPGGILGFWDLRLRSRRGR